MTNLAANGPNIQKTASLVTKGPEASANAWSDDFKIEVTFDARHYLAKATEKELLELEGIDWRGDYAADDVYLSATAGGDEDARKLETYLAKSPVMPNGDQVGFEVEVDQDEAMAWLKEHRADMHVAVMARRLDRNYDTSEDHLDDMVHDVMAEKASRINNSGAEAQADFLGIPSEGGKLEDDMDDAVHDLASRKASEINNAAGEERLRFLLRHGVTVEEIEDALSETPQTEI